MTEQDNVQTGRVERDDHGTSAARISNPWRIPDDKRYRTINVSGGRSSAYMLRQILDAHGGELPPRTVAVFCNTGREMPETLDFLQDIETWWNVPLIWLEYHLRKDEAPKHHYKIVSYESASREGEPFEALLQSRGMLPNIKTRFCTAELKVRTVQRYMRRGLGLDPNHVINVLGIRYDEPRRWEKAIFEGCNTEYPMVHGRTVKADVLDYWYGQSEFNLAIDSIYGNCDLCFLKGKRRKLTILRQRPDLADWWIEQERLTIGKKTGPSTFSKRETVQHLLDLASQPQFWPPDDDDVGVDCFCTD